MMLPIWMVPVFGLVFFVLLGLGRKSDARIRREMIRKQREIKRRVR